MSLRISCCFCAIQRQLAMPVAASVFHFPRRNRASLAESFVKGTPEAFRPYLRLARVDKPIGTWLLFIPSTWGIAFATTAGHLPDLKLLALFGAGALLMRGAGCTVNDILDKDFDKDVERTRDRPLASGQLSSLNAMMFLGGQLSLSLCILLQLNWYSVALGVASVPLVCSYPLFKRFTYWPQAALGLTFNWGTMLGYSAAAGFCDWSVCLSLYLAAFHWTLIYDTIYAHQDKEDDAMIGVKSTALLFKENTKYFLWLFSMPMAVGLASAGIEADMSYIYYAGVVATMSLIWRQIFKVNLNDGASCMQYFKSNKNTGLLLTLFIVADKFLNL